MYATVTGAQLEYERDFLSGLNADGWTMTGSSEITLLQLSAGARRNAERLFDVCLDLRGRRFFDETGAERIDTTGVDFQPLQVTVERSEETAVWLVEQVSYRHGAPTCEPSP